MLILALLLAGQFVASESRKGIAETRTSKELPSPLMQMRKNLDETTTQDFRKEESVENTRIAVDKERLLSPLEQIRQKMNRGATQECPPCRLESTFTRRIIRQILPDLENLSKASVESQEVTVHFTFSPYELHQLLLFVDSTDSENSRMVQEVISTSVSFVGINTHSYLSLILDNLFPDRNYLISLLLLSTFSSLFAFLILRLLVSRMTRNHLALFAVAFFLLSDWTFTAFRLYHEEMAHAVTLMERNADSCSQDRNFLTKVANFITRSDACLEFNQAALVNILWKVSPGKILTESFGSSLVLLAKNIGASFQAACSQVSLLLLAPFLGFVLLLTALYWGISIRAPLGFAIEFGGRHQRNARNIEYVCDRNRRPEVQAGIEDLPMPPAINNANPERQCVTTEVEVQTIVTQASQNDAIVAGNIETICAVELNHDRGVGTERELNSATNMLGAGDRHQVVISTGSCKSGLHVESATQTLEVVFRCSATQTDVNLFEGDDETLRQLQTIPWNIRPLSPDSMN